MAMWQKKRHVPIQILIQLCQTALEDVLILIFNVIEGKNLTQYFTSSCRPTLIYKTCIHGADYWLSSSSPLVGEYELRTTFKAKRKTPPQRSHWMPFRSWEGKSESIALLTLRRGSSPFVERQKKRSLTLSIDGTLYLKQATCAHAPDCIPSITFPFQPSLPSTCNKTPLSYT